MRDFVSENEEKILELENRRHIYEVVRKYAGSHLREVERKCNLPQGTVRHHLDFLKKNDLIREIKEDNSSRFFPKDSNVKNNQLLGLLRQKSLRNILIYILTNEPCNNNEISEAVHLSPSTISFHLKKLVDKGVINSKREGQKSIFTLIVEKDEVISLLITYRESFLDKLVDQVIEMWDTD